MIPLRAVLQPDFVFQPWELVVQEKKSETRIIRFTPVANPEVAIKSVTSPHPAFSWKILPSGVELQVTYDRDKWHEEPGGLELVILTTSQNHPGVFVPIRLKLEP